MASGVGLTNKPTRTGPPSLRADNPAAVAGVTYRGDGGKKLKPTQSAPSATAVSKASGELMPQILTWVRRFMAAAMAAPAAGVPSVPVPALPAVSRHVRRAAPAAAGPAPTTRS